MHRGSSYPSTRTAAAGEGILAMPEPFQKGNSREYVEEYERIFRGKVRKMSDWDKVYRVFDLALRRMRTGFAVYGEFDASTDTRNLLSEAQEELLDAINYLGMQYLKLEELKKRNLELKAVFGVENR